MDINEAIEKNRPLVYFHLHKFGLAADPDAYSAALEALWVALKTYDESKGSKFSTYASVCIYNAIGMYLRKLKRLNSVVLVPYENGDLCRANDPLDQLIQDRLVDTSMAPAECYAQQELRSVIQKAVKKVLDESTSDTAKQILTLWIESNGTMRQTDLARRVGCAQPTVSRILSAAMYKLRKELEDYLC